MALFSLVNTLFSGNAENKSVLLLVFIVFVYFVSSLLWYFAEYIFHFAIIISPDGIWFHGYGKRFYKWDSLICLNTKNTGISKQNSWGIKAQNTQIVYLNVVAKWLVGNWIYNNFIPLQGIVKVPRKKLLFRDMEAFKNTEFGQELFRFAPHLFDEVGKEKRKHRLSDDVDSKFEWSDENDAEIVKRG